MLGKKLKHIVGIVEFSSPPSPDNFYLFYSNSIHLKIIHTSTPTPTLPR